MKAGGTASGVEAAKRRCVALLESLSLVTERKLSSSSKATLFRLIQSELRFLRGLSAAEISSRSSLSLNIGHLEAVIHVLLQPSVTAVSRVCRPIRLSSSESAYVDIVCSLEGDPVWITVSDRNPRFIAWEGEGLKRKIAQILDAARRSSVMLRPSWIVAFFSFGLVADVHQKLRSEFEVVELEMDPFVCEEVEMEGRYTNVLLGRFFPDACGFKIKVDGGSPATKETVLRPSDYPFSRKNCDELMDLNLGSSFCSLLSAMKCWCCPSDDLDHEVEFLNLVNFDTTAFVAIVSGITDRGTEKLLGTPERELRARFKGNYEFVISQVKSENQKPLHTELSGTVLGKQGIVCESVCAEFKELILMCGGPNEKTRAECILKFIKVVPDSPSTRVLSLPTTRKMALKNKVVFGTGDHWHAPTVTANMAFVRAVTQTGVSLSVIEHRSRALIGE